MEDPFLVKLAEIKELSKAMYDPKFEGDPVELRRTHAQAMLDLNALASEEGFDTAQWIEKWKGY